MKRCGGSGTVRSKSLDKPFDPRPLPCPGCPDCSPCTRCGGTGKILNAFRDLRLTCPDCHGSGTEPKGQS